MSDAEPKDPARWMQWRFSDPHASVGKPDSTSHKRYDFARHLAPVLAGASLPNTPIGIHRPSQQVSLRTVYFTTEDRSALIVVVGDHEDPRSVELALPYALEHTGDRDLVFVLPTGTEWPFLARLPWLDHHCRVFTHSNSTVTEHPIPLRTQVHDRIRMGPVATTYQLSPQHLGWADEVISWANAHPQLQTSHRAGNLGWQVEGRRVLTISRAKGNKLRIKAGSQSKSVATNQASVVLDGPLADPEPFREAIRQAIADRLRGSDTANVENRLQARIQRLAAKDRFGLETLVPEYPANRPTPGGQGRGLIDFLGVDGDGRLHVVETKVGASEATVLLQALDYWVWVEANRESLASQFGADPSLQTSLSVVVLAGKNGSILERRNGFVADRLSRSVPLEVWSVQTHLDTSISLLPVPKSRYLRNSRWTDRMKRRSAAAATLEGGSLASRDDPLAGIYSGSAHAAQQLSETGNLHSYVHLPHSSQRFALDLFGSLDEAGVAGILGPFFGPILSSSTPEFEWTDDSDLLREATTSRPYQTQVDVLLRGRTLAGRSVALLVEVKLTEDKFGGCSHAEQAPPDLGETCGHSGAFGGNTEACWQLRNRDQGKKRRYDEFTPTAGEGISDLPLGCWYRERNQPMRLAALAGVLVEEGDLDACLAVLTVPAGHCSMRRRWAESIELLGVEHLGWLDPEVVMTSLPRDAASFLTDRYGLGPAASLPASYEDDDLDSWGWLLAARLWAALPGDRSLTETHPGGGLYDCLTLETVDESGGPLRVDINLAGSLHVWPTPQDSVRMGDVWERMRLGEVDQVTAWATTHLGVSNHDHRDGDWLVVMASVAQRFAGRARWRTRSSDFSGLPDRLQDRLARQPSRRSPDIWCLVDTSDQVSAAVDLVEATAWIPGGSEYNLRVAADQFFEDLAATAV